MNWSTFEGVICPLLCPLDEKERVIEEDARRFVRHQLAHGLKGFLVPSGTGEFYSLRSAERRRFIEIVADAVPDGVPVIAMVGDCGTLKALDHLVAAREAGADAVMAPPIYYTPVPDAALKLYFRTLAREGGMPFWLYQQPQETKITMSPELIAELAEEPNIVGVKISTWWSMESFHKVLRIMRPKPEFRILMGEDFNFLSAFVLGGHGAVSTMSNILPDAVVGVWESVQRGDYDAARRWQDRILEVQAVLIPGVLSSQSACKYVLKRQGLFSTNISTSPMTPLRRQDEEMLEAAGKKLGLF